MCRSSYQRWGETSLASPVHLFGFLHARSLGSSNGLITSWLRRDLLCGGVDTVVNDLGAEGTAWAGSMGEDAYINKWNRKPRLVDFDVLVPRGDTSNFASYKITRCSLTNSPTNDKGVGGEPVGIALVYGVLGRIESKSVLTASIIKYSICMLVE